MKENWKVNGAIAGVAAVAWVTSFALHNHYLSFVAHGPGIDLLFIPSGVRMLALLVGGISAAVGICLGSLFLAGPEFHTGQIATILAVSLGSGLFPYAALRMALRLAKVDGALAGLTAARLPLISLGVAAGSSLLHNLLFAALGINAWRAFWSNALAMAAGDFLGILLALVVVFVALRLLRRASP